MRRSRSSVLVSWRQATAVPYGPDMDVVIAGGGVAGLEALLALHAMAGERVSLRLIAPDPDFSYRPLAVAEPFGLGHAYHVPLTQLADETDAELVIDAVVGADDASRKARLRDGGGQGFDARLLATGGRAVAGVEGATTWWPEGDPDVYGGLLRDVEEGYTKRLAIVVPLGAVWPLPAYELALMTAGEAREMGHDDVQVTIVTPEPMPLSLFGDEAGEAVAEELRWAGVDLRTGGVARKTPGRPAARAGRRAARRPAHIRGAAAPGPGNRGSAMRRGRVYPRRRRRPRRGVRANVGGRRRRRLAAEVRRPRHPPGPARGRSHRAPRRRRRRGRPRGAGRARPACSSVTIGAACAAAATPGAPRCGGHRARSPASTSRAGWSSTAITPPAGEEPPEGGITVRRSVRALRGAEAQHLFDLARRLDSSDPAVAALGRRMRELRDR